MRASAFTFFIFFMPVVVLEKAGVRLLVVEKKH